MAVSVLCLLLMVPWVSLQCVIVAISGHAHLLFASCKIWKTSSFQGGTYASFNSPHKEDLT